MPAQPIGESFQAYLQRHDLCGLFAAATRPAPPGHPPEADAYLQTAGHVPIPSAVASIAYAVDAAILQKCGASRPVQTLPSDCQTLKLSNPTIQQLRTKFAGQRILLSVDATAYGGALLMRSRMENLARFIQHLLSVQAAPSAADASAAALAGVAPTLPSTKIVICYTDLHEPKEEQAALASIGSGVAPCATHVGFGDPTGSFLGSMIDSEQQQHLLEQQQQDHNGDGAPSGTEALAAFCAAHLAPSVGQSHGIQTLTALLHQENIHVLKLTSPTSLLEPMLPFHDTVVLLPNISWMVPDSAPRSLAVLDPILAFCDVYVVNSLQQFVIGGPLVGYVPRAVGECFLGPRAAADVKRFAELATAKACKMPSHATGSLRPRVLLLGDMDELSGAADDPCRDPDAGGRHIVTTGKSAGVFAQAVSVLEHVERVIPLLCTKFDCILLAGVAAVEAWRQLYPPPQTDREYVNPRPDESSGGSKALHAAVAKLLAAVAAQAAVAHPTCQLQLRIASDFCIIKRTASGKAKAACLHSAALAHPPYAKVPAKFYVADVGPATRRSFHEALAQASSVLALGTVTPTHDHVAAARAKALPAIDTKTGQPIDDLPDLAVNASVSWLRAVTMAVAPTDASRPSWNVCGEVWAEHCLRVAGITAVTPLPIAEAVRAIPKWFQPSGEEAYPVPKKPSAKLSPGTASSVVAPLQQLEADAGIKLIGLPYRLVASQAVGEPLPALVSFPAPIPSGSK